MFPLWLLPPVASPPGGAFAFHTEEGEKRRRIEGAGRAKRAAEKAAKKAGFRGEDLTHPIGDRSWSGCAARRRKKGEPLASH